MSVRRGGPAIELHTWSGSVYWLARGDRGGWWVKAANVPNPKSHRLEPGRWWAIEPGLVWAVVRGGTLVLAVIGLWCLVGR